MLLCKRRIADGCVAATRRSDGDGMRSDRMGSDRMRSDRMGQRRFASYHRQLRTPALCDNQTVSALIIITYPTCGDFNQSSTNLNCLFEF